MQYFKTFVVLYNNIQELAASQLNSCCLWQEFLQNMLSRLRGPEICCADALICCFVCPSLFVFFFFFGGLMSAEEEFLVTRPPVLFLK